MRADEWVREGERESKLVDALYKARYLISLHNGMTVRCDGEEWPLDFGPELKMIDAALKTAGIDAQGFKQWALDGPSRTQPIVDKNRDERPSGATDAN